VALVAEVTAKGHSALVFCASRRGAEVAAAALAAAMPPECDAARGAGLAARRAALLAELEEASGAPAQAELAAAVAAGCGWHHAGLTAEERLAVESGFRSGALCAITATSTLAAGARSSRVA
jgi:replicative superfamily II helicase